ATSACFRRLLARSGKLRVVREGLGNGLPTRQAERVRGLSQDPRVRTAASHGERAQDGCETHVLPEVNLIRACNDEIRSLREALADWCEGERRSRRRDRPSG